MRRKKERVVRSVGGGLADAKVLALALVPSLVLLAALAWADHPVPGMRTAAWHPLTAALVFGGLSVVAGLLVVVVVSLLTRRPPRDDAGG